MTRMDDRTAGLVAMVGLAALFATTASVMAAEVCVECAEPAATYRCVVAIPGAAPIPSLSSKAAQVVCMTELAKAGGHRFCRVTQGAIGGLCNGPERVVALSQPSGTADGDAKQASEDAARVDPERKQPPQTLADLAKETARTSTDELKKAGQAIKDGADTIGTKIGNAITCVATLFKAC